MLIEEGFDRVTEDLIDAVLKQIKTEKLAKSDKETVLRLLGAGKTRGFTGVPKVELDLSFTKDLMDKYLLALKWMLMGRAAGKEAEKAVEELGLKNILPVGAVFGTFLHAIDKQREHYFDLTGREPPKIHEDSLKYSLDFVNERTGKWVDQSLLAYKNKVLQELQDRIETFNQQNVAVAHESYHALLKDKGIVESQIKTIKEKQELIQEAARKVVEKKMSLVQMKQHLKDTTKDYGKDWDRLVTTEIGMATGAGTHLAVQEVFGAEDEEMLVANVNIRDQRCCDECESWSRKPDGSLKLYRLSDIKPVGYNVSRKRKDWHLTAGTQHPHCLPKWTQILTEQGWKNITDLDKTEMVFSQNLETGQGEWVGIKEIVKFHQKTITQFQNKWFYLACANDHDHVIVTPKKPQPRIKNNQSLPKSAAFCVGLTKWEGRNDPAVVIGKHAIPSADFAAFMGIFLSEGNLSKPPSGSWQIKISQKKYLDEFAVVCQKVFDKTWVGKESIYIPLYDPDLVLYFKQFGKSWEKHIPNEIKNMNADNIKIFLRYFRMGDGTYRDHQDQQIGNKTIKTATEIQYFTSSRFLMSGICELILKIGRSFSVTEPDEPKPVHHRNGLYLTKHTVWKIRQKSSKTAQIKSLCRSEIEYNDFVYGIELDRNHTLFAMQFGKVCLTGNCRCVLVYIPKGWTVDTRGVLRKLNPEEKVTIEKSTGLG